MGANSLPAAWARATSGWIGVAVAAVIAEEAVDRGTVWNHASTGECVRVEPLSLD